MRVGGWTVSTTAASITIASAIVVASTTSSIIIVVATVVVRPTISTVIAIVAARTTIVPASVAGQRSGRLCGEVKVDIRGSSRWCDYSDWRFLGHNDSASVVDARVNCGGSLLRSIWRTRVKSR